MFDSNLRAEIDYARDRVFDALQTLGYDRDSGHTMLSAMGEFDLAEDWWNFMEEGV